MLLCVVENHTHMARLILGCFLLVVTGFISKAQTTVFQENFSSPASSGTFSTISPIATGSVWKINRSGIDFGARINGGFLDITNDASGSANANGWAFSFINSNTDFSGSSYKSTFTQNTGPVEWVFNFRQLRTDPSGFASGSYGVALILGCDTTNPTLSTAKGYAVILGQSGSFDSVKLVRFSGGLVNFTPILVANGDFGAEYLSTKVTFNPTTQQWELFLRNDGATGFRNPDSVALVSQGTAINSTHTSVALPYFGGYWQGSTGASQNALFDNVTIRVTSSCTAPTVAATNPVSTSITTSSANFSWTRGNGSQNLAIINPISQTALAPSNGNAYTGNSVYGSGDLLGSGNYVISSGTANSVSVSSLSPQTSYQLRVYENNGSCYQLNNPAILNFSTLALEPSGYPSSFSASASSFSSVLLSFSSLNSLTNANGYLILRKAGSLPTSVPADGLSYTVGQTLGDGVVAALITNPSTTSITISGLADQTNHFFVLIPFNGNGSAATNNFRVAGTTPSANALTPQMPSSSSDFIASGTFTYSSDIDPLLYQATSFSNTSGSISVFRVTLRDGGISGDADANPTTVQQLVFRGSNFNQLRGAVLSNGNAIISGAGVVDSTGNSITFSGLSISAADNNSFDITLRVSFLNKVTDNSQLSISLSANDVVVSSAGSQLAAFTQVSSSTLNNRNRLEVTATQLAWTQQPLGAGINTPMVPNPRVSAVDVEGNVDADYSGSISISSSGSMDSTSKSRNIVSGTAIFENIRFVLSQSNVTLSAQSTGFSTVLSNLFSIATFPINAYRTSNSGNSSFPSGSGWEQFDGSSWISSTAPSASTSQTIYVRNNLSTSASFGNTVKFQVENGGTLNINHVSTSAEIFVQTGGKLNVNASASARKIVIDSGGTLEVLSAAFGPTNATDTLLISSGGKMNINDANALNTSNIWRGVEQFQTGSEVIIANWNYGGSGTTKRLIENPSQISLNSDGAYFGHLTFSGLPSSLFSVFAGGSGLLKLTSGNLTSNTQTGGNNFCLANSNLTVEIGGNVITNSGQFSAFASTAGGFPKLVIDGNLIIQGGIFNLNQGIASACLPILEIQGNIMGTSGTLTSSDGGSKITFVGNSSHKINMAIPVGNNYRIEVPNGQTANLFGNPLQFSASTDTLEIQDGGVFNFNGQNLTGSGTFLLKTGGSAKITSIEGLNTSGSTGNVQVSSRSVQAGAQLIYTGNSSPQITGNAVTGGNKKIILEKDSTFHAVILPSSLVQTDSFIIKQGTFLETQNATLSGSGTLTMLGGIYSSSFTDTIIRIPQLTGNYSLNAGTVALTGNGTQVLRGGRDYFNVSVSGTNVFGVDRKTISSAIVINSNLSISGGAIFDIENKGITGTGGLSMVSGRLRISKLSGTTTPELTATAVGANYNLTGGTIEWYGSNSTGTEQKIRGKDGQNRTIQYFNIDLNANGQNPDGNVWVNGSFGLNGTMNVAPQVRFKMDAFETITGSGSVNFQNGSTFRFAHPQGLSPNGQIQVTGSKNYGTAVNFVYETNANNHQLGSEFPDSVASLSTIVQGKTTSSSKNLYVRDSLMIGGVIDQGNHTITLAHQGTFTSVGGPYFVNGWFKKIGNTAFTFPVGSLVTGPKYLSISAPDHAQDALQVSYEKTSFPAVIPISSMQTPLSAVNPCEGWNLDETDDFGNSTAIQITLRWDSSSRCNLGPEFIQNPANLRVAHFNGAVWEDKGNTQFSSNGSEGWVISDTVSQFSPFRLGSIGGNALPVKLVRFSAKQMGDFHEISWASAEETHFDRYEIEQSSNGISFSKVATHAGKGNGSNYVTLIPNPHWTHTFYRLKMIDWDGSFAFSSIVQLSSNELGIGLQWQMNQGSWMAQLSSAKPTKVKIDLASMSGQILHHEQVQLLGQQPHVWQTPEFLPHGVYLITLEVDGQKMVKKLVIQR